MAEPVLAPADVFCRATLNFAARTYYFFSGLPRTHVIQFDSFCQDPNLCLSSFLNTYGLLPFDFRAAAAEDQNILGKRNLGDVSSVLDRDSGRVADMLLPVRELMRNRFGIDRNKTGSSHNRIASG